MESLSEPRKTQKIFIIITSLFQIRPEPEAQGINRREMLAKIKDALLIYFLSKSQMSPLHEFVILTDEHPQKLTSDLDEIRKQIQLIDTAPNQANIMNIFKNIEAFVPGPINEVCPNTIQIIFITSNGQLNFLKGEPLLKNPDIFIDFIYFNISDSIESTIKQVLDELNQIIPNKSFGFIIKSNLSLCRAISLLTAHPQQRKPQCKIEPFLSLT